MKRSSFSKRLVAFRDANQWTNAGLAEHLSKVIGREISVRTIENFIQGRKPHLIWKHHFEAAIKE